jgi:hypothetical protein
MDDPELDLENRITNIEQRNARVESDKAWEISFTRKLFIAVSTYIIAAVWLVVIKDTNPWLKALVPAVGYILSTLSLPFVKRWWIERLMKKKSLIARRFIR